MKKTRIDIAEDLHRLFPEYSEARQLRPIVNAMVNLFRRYLMNGDRIHLSRFGVIEIKQQTGYEWISGLTGKKTRCPARKIPNLRATKLFRKELNNG